jgi:hypothetical protein
MPRHQLVRIVACVWTLSLAGCGNSGTTTSPSATTTTSSTEYFTGTLSPTTSQFYSFTVNTAGAVTVTLASTSTARIGAAASARLSLGLGTPSGFGCAPTQSADVTPGLNAQLSTASSAAGIYCVDVADPGDLATDVTFVIRIVHT